MSVFLLHSRDIFNAILESLMFTHVSVFCLKFLCGSVLRRAVPRQPTHFPHAGQIWCLPMGFLPLCAAALFYAYHQPPSSQSQVISRCTTITYRCCPISRVRRHRASSPQGSSTDGCYLFFRYHPWTICCAPLYSHAQYWYCNIICACV